MNFQKISDLHKLIFLKLKKRMKKITPISGQGNEKILINKINQLIIQNNEQKEEIRQIKQKLRINAHFGKRS